MPGGVEMKPHKCPVCNGSGKALDQFGYAPPASCHACSGTGIVWGPGQSQEPKITVKFVPNAPRNTDPLWANQTGDVVTVDRTTDDVMIGPYILPSM